ADAPGRRGARDARRVAREGGALLGRERKSAAPLAAARHFGGDAEGGDRRHRRRGDVGRGLARAATAAVQVSFSRGLAFAVLAVVLSAGTSCKKKAVAGGPCDGADFVSGEGVCQDGTTFLACQMDGTYAPFACKGKRGCYGAGKGRYGEICDF